MSAGSPHSRSVGREFLQNPAPLPRGPGSGFRWSQGGSRRGTDPCKNGRGSAPSARRGLPGPARPSLPVAGGGERGGGWPGEFESPRPQGREPGPLRRPKRGFRVRSPESGVWKGVEGWASGSPSTSQPSGPAQGRRGGAGRGRVRAAEMGRGARTETGLHPLRPTPTGRARRQGIEGAGAGPWWRPGSPGSVVDDPALRAAAVEVQVVLLDTWHTTPRGCRRDKADGSAPRLSRRDHRRRRRHRRRSRRGGPRGREPLADVRPPGDGARRRAGCSRPVLRPGKEGGGRRARLEGF